MRANGLYTADNKFISFGESQSSLFREIASRQHSISMYLNLIGFLPDPDPILKKNGKDITVYREIMQDPHVYSVVEQRKAQVLSMEWEINRGGSKSRNVKLIKDLFEDDDFDLWTTIEQELDATPYGFKPFEIMWERIGSFILPVKLIDKPPEWFVFDQFNQLKFRSKNNPVHGEQLPPRKFLAAQHKPSYNNPYGERILSRCFWPQVFKKADIKWLITFLEKYGMSWAVGKMPRNKMGEGSKEVSEFLDQLESMIQDAITIIPDDNSVEFKEPPGKQASGDMFIKTAEFFNTEISKAVLTQTLTTEVKDTGSFAASKTHADMLGHLGRKDKRITENVKNTLIRYIYELNFNDTDIPKFSLFEPKDVDKELADRDRVLFDIGVRPTKEYYQREYNLSDKDFNLDYAAQSKDAPTPIAPPVIPPPAQFAEAAASQSAASFFKYLWNKMSGKVSATSAEKNEQDNITALSESIPDDVLQLQMDETLKPVFNMINEGSDFSEVKDQLTSLYPDMNTSKLEDILTKMIFVAHTFSRASKENS